MSDRYDRGGSNSRRRGTFNHWLPLVLTLTVATAGVAAWAWSQRSHDDDDYDDDEDGEGHEGLVHGNSSSSNNNNLDYEHGDYGDNPPYGATTTTTDAPTRPAADGNTINMTDATSAVGAAAPSSVASGWSARMTGALGGASTSPQQWMGSAQKAVTAGVAAASAAVGGALASIREGDKDAYADHETWSEEADARKARTAASASAAAAATAAATTTTTAAGVSSSSVVTAKDAAGHKRRIVAIVVSADTQLDGVDEDTFTEHASILSYIPRHNDFAKTRIFVLIYAPGLKESTTLDASTATIQPTSLSSSFSNIGADQAQQSPKVEAKTASAGLAFNAVNAQALGLVEKESDIIPFTSPSGHAHILHLLEPDVVYLQESLTGDNGSVVNQLQNWMRNEIVVVVGAESGGGAGLADSESEAEKTTASDVVPKWWQRDDRVGRGRGVVVVDGLRVNDDWIRRVQGQE